MELGKFDNFGIVYYTLIAEFSHNASMPGAVMMQHAISNITMRTVYSNVVHICYTLLDTHHLIGRIFLKEPAMTIQVLCHLLTLASQAEVDLLRKQAC